jgi:hypothetical protein
MAMLEVGMGMKIVTSMAMLEVGMGVFDAE